MCKELSACLPDYEWSKRPSKTVLDRLYLLHAKAVAHSKRAIEDVEKTGEKNPSTEIHKVIELLLSLKAENK